jgi:hypothetical protein
MRRRNLIQVIGPPLHHLSAFGKVLGVVVGRPHLVTFPVSKLAIRLRPGESQLAVKRIDESRSFLRGKMH